MGESNNVFNKTKQVDQRENNLNNFLKKDAIEILENINNGFIKQITTDLSDLIKNHVQLVSHSIKIKSYNNKKNINDFRCFNLIEILPYKTQSAIFFSANFLSVIIEILFGGCTRYTNRINQISDITLTEHFINKKIMQFIIKALSNNYKKFFLFEINFINIQIVIDFKKSDFNLNQVFLIHSFNFNIYNTEVFFSIFIPLSVLKKISQKKFIVSYDKQNICKEQNLNDISMNDISYVKLDIVTKIVNLSLSNEKIYTLSVGDVLSIKKPDKIVSFIENKPIFFGIYNKFNEQYIVFIEEFINSNLESIKIRNNRMSNIKKNSNNKISMNFEQKIPNASLSDASLSDASLSDASLSDASLSDASLSDASLSDASLSDASLSDASLSDASLSDASLSDASLNKTIVLDSSVNITVELGRSKIKIQDFLSFSKGSMLILDKSIKEPLDIFINGHLIASGEIVVSDKQYGLRLISIKKSLNTINS